jgi:prepilin-type N-terminal cleavage/methylation domain-containing protein
MRQFLSLCGRHARRGFTMIELLVALVLLGLVSAAIYRVLINNQRIYMAQTQRIDLSQNIRAAATILPAEFRELDAFDGDIAAMSATQLDIRAMRWLSFVCVPPALTGNNAGNQMIVRGGTPGQPMFFGSRPVRETTDSLLIYWDGNQTIRTDDYYVPARIAATPGNENCPAVGAVPAQPGTRLVWDGNFLFGTNVPGAITLGAPVRGFERVTYRLYQPAGDTSWYIGMQPANQTIQPLIGPVLANGLTFQYFNAAGTVTAIRTQVARIDITVRARTAAPVRSGGQAPLRAIVDSIVTSVALRNNRRF